MSLCHCIDPHIKPPLLQQNKFCCQSYHDGHCSSWCAIVWDYTCMNGTGYGMGTGLGTIRNLHKLQIGNRPGNAQWQWPSLVSTLQELLISLPRAASSFPTFSALSHYKCIAQPISTYKCFIQDELPLMLSYYRIAFEFCGSKFQFHELLGHLWNYFDCEFTKLFKPVWKWGVVEIIFSLNVTWSTLMLWFDRALRVN